MLIFKKNFQKTMCLIGNFSKFIENKKFSSLLKRYVRINVMFFFAIKAINFFDF
jgi:hypothetical protein